MDDIYDGRPRVLYLVGTSHCGSTLLSLILDSHPDVASLGEMIPHRRSLQADPAGLLCSCGEPLGTCEFWLHIFRSVQGHGLSFSSKQWTSAYKYINPLLHRLLTADSRFRIVQNLQGLADSHLPMHRRRMRVADCVNIVIYRELLRATGARVALDIGKGLRKLKRLLTLRELDVYVLRVVRDVRAFANSMDRRGSTSREAAWRWLWFQKAADHAIAKAPCDHVLEVRYEDVCADVAQFYASVCDLLEIRRCECPKTFRPREHHLIGNKILSQDELIVSLNERWREVLSSEQIQQVMGIAGKANERFGYDA